MDLHSHYCQAPPEANLKCPPPIDHSSRPPIHLRHALLLLFVALHLSGSREEFDSLAYSSLTSDGKEALCYALADDANDGFQIRLEWIRGL